MRMRNFLIAVVVVIVMAIGTYCWSAVEIPTERGNGGLIPIGFTGDEKPASKADEQEIPVNVEESPATSTSKVGDTFESYVGWDGPVYKITKITKNPDGSTSFEAYCSDTGWGTGWASGREVINPDGTRTREIYYGGRSKEIRTTTFDKDGKPTKEVTKYYPQEIDSDQYFYKATKTTYWESVTNTDGTRTEIKTEASGYNYGGTHDELKITEITTIYDKENKPIKETVRKSDEKELVTIPWGSSPDLKNIQGKANQIVSETTWEYDSEGKLACKTKIDYNQLLKVPLTLADYHDDRDVNIAGIKKELWRYDKGVLKEHRIDLTYDAPEFNSWDIERSDDKGEPEYREKSSVEIVKEKDKTTGQEGVYLKRVTKIDKRELVRIDVTLSPQGEELRREPVYRWRSEEKISIVNISAATKSYLLSLPKGKSKT